MYKILRATLTVIVLVAFAASFGNCATKSRKVVKSTTLKAVAVKAVTGPKLLKIVAGQPFETPPSGGASKLSVSLCAEETEPATFTVRFGKPLAGVRIAAGDLLFGTSKTVKIGKESIIVSLVEGDNLTPSEAVTIDSTPKQIWVDVTVPRGCKPGVYKGSIGFYYQGKLLDFVPIEVNVRNMRLVGSSKQYSLYTSLGPCGQGVCELSGDSYCQFLGRVAKMGFRAVSVCDEPAKLSESLSACAAAGLTGAIPVLTFACSPTVPTVEDIRAAEDARKAAGISNLFYFSASNPATEDEALLAVERSNVFRQAKVQVATTVADDVTLQKLLPVVDAINYQFDMPYVQALINGGSTRTDKWEWYWWDARESVNANRINAGVALWRSGLYGCMPYWMPKDVADNPANLDSLLCEALREGVDDTRYLTTYMKALRELKDKKRASDKEYIATTENYISSFMTKPLDKVTPADLRAFREKMAEFSIKLTSML